jgi:hypothetical protein
MATRTKKKSFIVHNVQVTFPSCHKALRILGLPTNKVFRRELKRRGHMIYKHNGTQYLFTTVPRRGPDVFEA